MRIFPFHVKVPNLEKKKFWIKKKTLMVTVPDTCNTGFFLTSLKECVASQLQFYRGVVLKVFL
jgi:hypothetical protein